MAKFKFLLAFIFLGFAASAQYTPMASYGYTFKRILSDSTLQIPTFCGVPTLRSTITNKAAIAFDSCNNRFYQYNPATAQWSYLGSGGGGSQNLQSVTDIGDSTTNSVYIYDSGAPFYTDLKPAEIKLWDINGGYFVGLNCNNVQPQLIISGTQTTYFLQDRIDIGNESTYYPFNNSTTDTFATVANIRAEKIDTANKWVNNITRTPGKDSIIYYIGGTRYAIKDSVGGGGSEQNGRFGNDTATVVMAKVHNDAGVTLTNGKVVFLSPSGTNSDAPSVRLANNKADSTSANTFGFVSGTIAVNDTGYVILSGKIEKLNTAAFNNGDIIYLDSVSGSWTKNKPAGPLHLVYLGAVVKSNNGNGSIFVKPQNGYEVDELHDVKITSKTNNDVLTYESATNLWKNKQISTVLGYTPIAPADTAGMLTNYAKTATVNAADALKLNISDTSVFQRKNIAAYSIKANATGSAANVSDFTFKQTAEQTMTKTVAWTGTTAASGATNHYYKWSQIGNTVWYEFSINYATASSATTAITFDKPDDMPDPYVPTGTSGASNYVARSYGTAALTTSGLSGTNVTVLNGLRRNSANTAWEFNIQFSSGAYRVVMFQGHYFTN